MAEGAGVRRRPLPEDAATGARPLKLSKAAPAPKGTIAKAPVAKAGVAKVGGMPKVAPTSKAPAKSGVPQQRPGAPAAAKRPPGAAPAQMAKVPAGTASGALAKRPLPKQPVGKQPMAKQPAAKAPAAAAAEEADGASQATDAPKRAESWKEFSDVDPLYAMLGELGTKKVITPEGEVDEDTLQSYLHRLTRQGVVSNTRKDWIEVWATMGIPIEKQDRVLQHIVTIGLESEVSDTMPEVLAELVKGHRVKIKAMEEAIATVFECGCDERGCLARFLHLIFPKSPTSEWGWSRVGWSWQQWWSTADRIFRALDPSSAFECLRNVLTTIEAESGAYLPHQQIWDEKRLAIVRKALCTYGELAEDELPAAIDIVLT